MKIWNKILLFFPIWLMFSMIFYGIVIMVFPESISNTKEDFEHLISTNFRFLFFSQLASLLAVVASILFFSRFIDKEKPKFFKSMFQSSGVFFGIVLGSASICLVLIIISFSQKTKISFNGMGIEFLWYIVVFIIVAVSEELMSRGFLFTNLINNCNKYLSVFISSLIFSILHLFNASFNLIGMINVLLIGVLLCLLFLRNNNLSIPIGFHFSWNLLQGPVFGFSVSGLTTSGIFEIVDVQNNKFSVSDFGLEGSYISTIVIGIFILYFFFLNKSFSFIIKRHNPMDK